MTAPYADPDAEAALVGGCLVWTGRVAEFADQLTVEDFYVPTHRALWGAITTLYQEGTPIDAVAAADRAKRFGGVDSADVVALMANALPPQQAHVDIILRYRLTRTLTALYGDAQTKLQAGEDPSVNAERLVSDVGRIDTPLLASSTHRARTLDDIIATAEDDTPWIIPGLIRARWKVMLVAEEGAGKALAVDTPVPTPSGWATMGELHPGDWVFDELGRQCQVAATTPVMDGRPCFEVLFSDGSTLVADENHQWVTTTKEERRNGRRRQTTLTTAALRATLAAKHAVETQVAWLERWGARFAPMVLPSTHPRRIRYVEAVMPVPSVPVRCIQVTSESGCFLAGRTMIPTHNSVLTRQIAACSAQGIHPLKFTPMPPIRTLVIDPENDEAGIAETGQMLVNALRRRVGDTYHPEAMKTVVWPGGFDLRTRRDRLEVEAEIAAHRPHLVVVGSLYQAFARRDRESHEEATEPLLKIFESWRARYNAALFIEHHAPQSQGGFRELRPYGSSLFLRWPHLGLNIREDRMEPGQWNVGKWRGDRQINGWPARLLRGGEVWPWEGIWPRGDASRFDPPSPRQEEAPF